MRNPSSTEKITWKAVVFFVFLVCAPLRAEEDPCSWFLSAWEGVTNYQATYRAVTFHEGKKTETLLRYSFEKPNKVRMDIDKPRKGAVLIYNPEILPKVRVRPFPKLRKLVLHYDLADKKVSSDSGGTIDRSDMGSRVREACNSSVKKVSGQDLVLEEEEKGKKIFKKYRFGLQGFLESIETMDENGKILESYQWTDLKINAALDPELFKKF